jgi:hypothetical protein
MLDRRFLRFGEGEWSYMAQSGSCHARRRGPRLEPDLAVALTPIRSESRSVPSHDRVGLDDDGGVQQRRHQAIEPDKEQSVRWREPWLGGNPAPQQVQLMAQEDNLGLQPCLRLERRRQYVKQQAKERNHSARLADLPVHYRVARVCSSDNAYFNGLERNACG